MPDPNVNAVRSGTRCGVVVMHLPMAVVAVAVGLALPVDAQRSPAIVADGPVLVSRALPSVHHNETVVAAHPRDARVLLACAMLGLADGRRSQVAAYRSHDGGRTWQLAVRSDEYFSGDPSCVFGENGTAYVASKTNHGLPIGPWASDTDSLTIRTSPDGGLTWSAPTRPVQANDRPWIVIGRNDRGESNLYAAFDGHSHVRPEAHDNPDFVHQLVVATIDATGRRLRTSASLDLPRQSTIEQRASLAGGVAVLADGSVMVLQQDMRLGGSNSVTGKLRELGGTLALFSLAPGGTRLDTVAVLGDVVTGYNNPATRGIPASIAVGRGPYEDQIFVVWTDFSSEEGVLRFGASRDRGRTWSKAAVAPTARAGAGHAFMPTIAVNSQGAIGLLWYQRRAESTTDDYVARFSASLDGGATWLADIALGPTAGEGGAAREASGRALPSGGDTAGLVAGADGVFHAVWVGRRAGVQQVLATRLTIR